MLVEDDASISEMVVDYLTKEGYRVETAKDAGEAAARFDSGRFDLILLDIMLPGGNGLDLLQKFRSVSRVPIVMLSAKDGEVDKALGLRFGADDYIAKPFSLMELSARVQAAIRRATEYADSAPGAAGQEQGVITVGSLGVDPDNFIVTKSGEPVKLTAKEFQILKLFVQHPKRVYTKAQIYQSVWGEEYYGDENVINVHMRRLREKIEDDPSNPKIIRTLWGIGYKLGEL
ncbi:response regulator transcription factor [Paenibacillus sp. P96]|uniref:Response regulator transcription factor n=1 Tax=Paenibacillus zeirhizosphaerae TaxID=2987519 RepID=A0ABT9FMN7_9BACL|nr:response regulator transcription factor [Paenibacillus sp. P96]